MELSTQTPFTLRLIVVLLVAIVVVGGWGVFRYEQELQRQKQERCEKAHTELQAAGVYGASTKAIKEACGTDKLTPEEQKESNKRQAEIEKSIREFECTDALRRYGVESEVTRQHCPGTEAGKKAGF